MQAGKADSRNQEKGNRKYAADRPSDCRHCYFWKGKRKGCSQWECYYLLPEEIPIPETMSEEVLLQEIHGNNTGDCRGCPYGKHFPCIGYCMQKILQEMREDKQSAGKEGEKLARRGK